MTTVASKKFQFRERLLNNEQLIGSLISIPSPHIVELMANIGFDWLFIDAEHGAISNPDLIPLIQAAGQCPCVVRVPDHSRHSIQSALDYSASGIIAPLVIFLNFIMSGWTSTVSRSVAWLGQETY